MIENMAKILVEELEAYDYDNASDDVQNAIIESIGLFKHLNPKTTFIQFEKAVREQQAILKKALMVRGEVISSFEDVFFEAKEIEFKEIMDDIRKEKETARWNSKNALRFRRR